MTQFEPLEIPDFIMDGKWEINILPSGFPPELLVNPNAYITSIDFPQEKLKFEKTSFGMPNFSNEEEYSSISIKYRDDVHMNFTNFIQGWMDSIYNRETRKIYNNWRNKSRDIIVELKNSLYGQRVVRRYKLNRCYPVELNSISLSDDGDVLEFSCSLECERVTILDMNEILII